jgi:class 3 adenylate cyclase/alpha-beta hydrolase superfamily lysophospholipase
VAAVRRRELTMEVPETRYVTVDGAEVAYQVVGNGPMDLLFSFGLGSHVELVWDVPLFAASLARLSSFSRLICFDRRGLGASDGVARGAMPTWEQWTEDMVAVLDAVESKQTAIMASLDGGPIGILFAAMHPEVVSALVLVNASARYVEADDYPIGVSTEFLDSFLEMLATTWGTPALQSVSNPSLAHDAEYLRLTNKMARASVTPRNAATQWDYMLRNLDVRQALALVQAPTLVIHVQETPFLSIEHGRYLAEHIKGATLVELPGGDIGLNPTQVTEVEAFLTGERPTVEIERILTTVLFTDIVGSTERAATLGDQRWRFLLDSHDRTVREHIRQFRGREVNTTGDGFVVSFDGPARAIRCALAVVEDMGKLGIELRVGLHTGECEVRGDDLGGLAVHIAARVGALAAPGEVLVSGTVKDLVVGSGIEFEDRGEHELKGVPGSWKLFRVQG